MVQMKDIDAPEKETFEKKATSARYDCQCGCVCAPDKDGEAECDKPFKKNRKAGGGPG